MRRRASSTRGVVRAVASACSIGDIACRAYTGMSAAGLGRHTLQGLAKAKGWAGFQLQGGGGGAALWLNPSPAKKGSIGGPRKILLRLTPGGDPDPKLGKNEWDFLESARRGGSGKSSFALYLVKRNVTILKNNFGRQNS